MKEENIKPINRIVYYDFSLDSFDFESILPVFFWFSFPARYSFFSRGCLVQG